MIANLLILPLAKQDLESLSHRDLQKVIATLEFLCNNPLGAQTADCRKAPEIRRAVADKYLVYHRYEPEEDRVRVYSIRHSSRRPPQLKDLLPE